jgi:hypothetical protein
MEGVVMMALDFSPFARSSIGFDRMFSAQKAASLPLHLPFF